MKELFERTYKTTKRKEYYYPIKVEGDEATYYGMVDDDGITIFRQTISNVCFQDDLKSFIQLNENENAEHFFVKKIFGNKIKLFRI